MLFSMSVCIQYVYTYILRLILFIGPFVFYTFVYSLIPKQWLKDDRQWPLLLTIIVY